jgi:hypothetical protein
MITPTAKIAKPIHKLLSFAIAPVGMLQFVILVDLGRKLRSFSLNGMLRIINFYLFGILEAVKQPV